MNLTEKEIEWVIVDCKIKKIKQGADGKDIDVVRELAKVPKVRVEWSIATATKQPLFPGPISKWTPLQRRLVYWLSFYSNIEGAYERPPSRIIYRDHLIDQWLEKQSEKAEREYEQKWLKGPSQGVSKTAYDQDEVFEI